MSREQRPISTVSIAGSYKAMLEEMAHALMMGEEQVMQGMIAMVRSDPGLQACLQATIETWDIGGGTVEHNKGR